MSSIDLIMSSLPQSIPTNLPKNSFCKAFRKDFENLRFLLAEERATHRPPRKGNESAPPLYICMYICNICMYVLYIWVFVSYMYVSGFTKN